MTTILQTREPLRRTWLNRIFSLVYTVAILALFYHHSLALFQSPDVFSLLIILADCVFAFMWVTYQGFRISPIRRREFLEKVAGVVDETGFPGLDVFVCTADPYREPPLVLVNTLLSVMGYDLPAERVTVYVSDDGGSQLTLFALLEAANFAKYWLPYCRRNGVVDRSPEFHFGSDNQGWFPETGDVKERYGIMKRKIEEVVERGNVSFGDDDAPSFQTFGKWTPAFTRQDHPAVIQVLLDREEDAEGRTMPSLVYVSREKCKSVPHNFKAGALNVLLRVSATMTNAPIILTLDCDTYSNDPKTALRALCYFLDPSANQKLAFIQFPQMFHNINKDDIYSAELKHPFQINDAGLDGLLGSAHHGTACFFSRRAFFGGPSSLALPEIPELSPYNVVNKPITSENISTLAHHVAACNYEARTVWGLKMGFRYGTLVEDVYTGYRMHCEGWRSIFCHPRRAAFIGDSPMSLHDFLSQTKRWSIGFLEMGFSKYSPFTFGLRSMNTFQAVCYGHYALWPIWAIPIACYAFVPQLALIRGSPVFPKVSDGWCYLYMFLFTGAYGQEFLEFKLAGGTWKRWWNSQRMWMIRGISSFTFAIAEFVLKSVGVSAVGFNVTSKAVDEKIKERYDDGMFEFGTVSPLFLPITTAALVNSLALLVGVVRIFKSGGGGDVFAAQVLIAGFVVVNAWPVYEAMIFRKDDGRIPLKLSVTSVLFACALYLVSSLVNY